MSENLQPTPMHLPISVAGTLIGTLIIFAFLAVLLLVYPDTGTAPVDPGAPTPEEMLAEVRARDRETLNSYGWVDREKGVVRIPVDEAMELWLAERTAGGTRGSGTGR
jgi:hypothetical protein